MFYAFVSRYGITVLKELDTEAQAEAYLTAFAALGEGFPLGYINSEDGIPVLSDSYQWIQNGESVETNKLSFKERIVDSFSSHLNRGRRTSS